MLREQNRGTKFPQKKKFSLAFWPIMLNQANLIIHFSVSVGN
jgi:hypothetical protein